VALKVLPPVRARDVLFAERFLREARALARLRHPHIVGVYDAGQAGDLLYIVMEFVDGASLRDLIREGSLGAAEALRLVPQICDAMQYAHDRGIIHRDIKPENILVDEEGNAKVADFGLAKLAGSDAATGTLTDANVRFGTPRYMAPEQLTGPAGRSDHRADIYSLGMMFYEMLTGELPVADYKPPSNCSEVDSRVDRVVERSIKASPDERYQKAAEVKDDVENIRSSPHRANSRPGRLVAAGIAIALVGAMLFLLRDRLWGSAGNPGQNPAAATNSQTHPATSTAPTAIVKNMAPLPSELLRHPLLSPDWEWSEPQNLGRR